TLSIPAYAEVGDPLVDSMRLITASNDLLAITWTDLVFDADCDNVDDRVERTWSLRDWCSQGSEGSYAAPALDIDGDGQVGDAYSLIIRNDSILRPLSGGGEVLMGAFDNEITYTQIIELAPADSSFTLSIPAYAEVGDPLVDSMRFTSAGYDLLVVTWADVVFDFDCDDVNDRIERTWSLRDWCSQGSDGSYAAPALDIDGDGQVGDAYALIIRNDSILRPLSGGGEVLMGAFGNHITYTQVIDLTTADSFQLNISGNVFHDELPNCSQDGSELGLNNLAVMLSAEPSGRVYQTTTDALGNYDFFICSTDTFYTVHLNLPFDYAVACPTSYELTLPPGLLDTVLHLPVQLPANCSQLLVDVGTWRLEPCTSSSYGVSYFNYSFDTIIDASIRLILDPEFDFLGSDIPPSSEVGDTLFFPLGDLEPLESGSFFLGIELDCGAAVGQTHCVQANIYPDTICVTPDPSWSGASVALSGSCQGDSLEFRIINEGIADMQQNQQYIVIEDVLMLRDEPFQLNIGEELQFRVPANGATWHVRAGQVPNHPGFDQPAVTIEGCGGLNIPGQALAFPQNDGDPFVSIDCQQSSGTPDWNGLAVSPAGLGDNHLVEQGIELEYLIRFRNTGPDTV
ncbi:MAG: hypothetical protein AAFW73_27005, partial [Bacteroidota bacterium]